MPSIRNAFPSLWLKVDDLQGKEVILTISKVVEEEVGIDRERKLVMYFRGTDKKMTLNKTNGELLADLLQDDDTDNWTGAAIILYPATTTAFGERKKVIRVKDYLPTKQAQAPGRGSSPQQPERSPLPEPAWATGDEDVPDNGDIPF